MQFPDSRLLIFAKAPEPGQVKTRLAPVLGDAGAAGFYRDLLSGTIDRFARAGLCPVVCWCSPDTRHEVFRRAAAEQGVELRQQRGDDLGARMAWAARDALGAAAAVVLIGGDCPVLGPDHLGRVLEWLHMSGVDAVLGPAEDGGYVLLGLRHFDPSLFEGIAWGGPRVLAATRQRLQRLGWRWKELEPLWDIDRPEDLARYRREVIHREDALSAPVPAD